MKSARAPEQEVQSSAEIIERSISMHDTHAEGCPAEGQACAGTPLGEALDVEICGVRHPNLLETETDWDAFRAELASNAEDKTAIAKEEPYDNHTVEEMNVGDISFLQTGISNRFRN